MIQDEMKFLWQLPTPGGLLLVLHFFDCKLIKQDGKYDFRRKYAKHTKLLEKSIFFCEKKSVKSTSTLYVMYFHD